MKLKTGQQHPIQSKELSCTNTASKYAHIHPHKPMWNIEWCLIECYY